MDLLGTFLNSLQGWDSRQDELRRRLESWYPDTEDMSPNNPRTFITQMNIGDPMNAEGPGSFSAVESTVPGATWTKEDELLSRIKDQFRPSMGRYRDESGRVQWGISPERELAAQKQMMDAYEMLMNMRASELDSARQMANVDIRMGELERRVQEDQAEQEWRKQVMEGERNEAAYRQQKDVASQQQTALRDRAKAALDWYKETPTAMATPGLNSRILRYASAKSEDEQNNIGMEIEALQYASEHPDEFAGIDITTIDGQRKVIEAYKNMLEGKYQMIDMGSMEDPGTYSTSRYVIDAIRGR